MTEASGVVDVVIPVYGNTRDLKALLASIRSAVTRRPIIVRIIDDASPEDIASLVPPDHSRCKYIFVRNAENIGFAASVNRALAASRNDAILLNSDTMVFGDWVDRLAETARADPRIATVTPLSNAATILSYPVPLIDNGDLADVSWGEVDRICAAGPREPIEIPTGVGFCMYVTRTCLDKIGVLDARTFRHGYGEECDLCRRAAADGWRNVAAPNVFVWHRGGGSFEGRRAALCAEAQKRLLERHPDYARLINAFIAIDPIKPVRAQIDAARVAAASSPRRLVLNDCLAAGNSSRSTFYLQRLPSWPWRHWRLAGANVVTMPNLPVFGARSQATIESLLRACRFEEIVVPRVSRIPHRLRAAIVAAATRTGVPVIATVMSAR